MSAMAQKLLREDDVSRLVVESFRGRIPKLVRLHVGRKSGTAQAAF
jgi:hypothetical protein